MGRPHARRSSDRSNAAFPHLPCPSDVLCRRRLVVHLETRTARTLRHHSRPLADTPHPLWLGCPAFKRQTDPPGYELVWRRASLGPELAAMAAWVCALGSAHL